MDTVYVILLITTLVLGVVATILWRQRGLGATLWSFTTLNRYKLAVRVLLNRDHLQPNLRTSQPSSSDGDRVRRGLRIASLIGKG